MLLPGFLLAAPQSGAATATASKSSVATDERAEFRRRALELAELYRTFEWTATEENVFHGEIRPGVPVHTPDISFHADGWHPDGRVNRGMPYAWGGFSSMEQFRSALKEGYYAGNIPATTQAPGSARAVGLDCSGFVARAWDLPVKQSTRTLGGLCYELESCADLLPGDILNKANGHVVLFKEWVDGEHTVMRVVEAGHLRVEENDYPVTEREQRGFIPMRYKPLDARWVPMDFSAPGFVGEGAGTWETAPDSDYGELGDRPSSIADVVVGEWVDYEMTDDFGGMPPLSRRKTMAARIEGDRVATQTSTEIEGKPLMKGSDCARTAPITAALGDFLAPEEPYEEVLVVASSIEEGTYEYGDRVFPAQRVSAFLETSWTMHGVTRPVTVEIEAILSSEVPLQGVIEAHFMTEIVWEDDGEGNIAVSQRTQDFQLKAFGDDARGR